MPGVLPVTKGGPKLVLQFSGLGESFKEGLAVVEHGLGVLNGFGQVLIGCTRYSAMTGVDLFDLQSAQAPDRIHVVADVTSHSYLGQSASREYCVSGEEQSRSWLIETDAT